MVLSSSSSRDEWLGASTASSEVHLSDVNPRRLSSFCGAAGTSALLLLCDCVAFHRRFVLQALFAYEYSSPAYTVRARRTFPHCRRRCFTNGTFAFSCLHLTLRSTQWARFEFVGRSRLLRLSGSAFWRRSPSSIFSSTSLGSDPAFGVRLAFEFGVLLSVVFSLSSVRNKSVVHRLDDFAPELFVDLCPLLARSFSSPSISFVEYAARAIMVF